MSALRNYRTLTYYQYTWEVRRHLKSFGVEAKLTLLLSDGIEELVLSLPVENLNPEP